MPLRCVSEVDPRSSCRRTGPGVLRILRSDVDDRDFGFDQAVVVPVAATQLGDRSATDVGDPQHGFGPAADMVDSQSPGDRPFTPQVIQSAAVTLIVLQST